MLKLLCLAISFYGLSLWANDFCDHDLMGKVIPFRQPSREVGYNFGYSDSEEAFALQLDYVRTREPLPTFSTFALNQIVLVKTDIPALKFSDMAIQFSRFDGQDQRLGRWIVVPVNRENLETTYTSLLQLSDLLAGFEEMVRAEPERARRIPYLANHLWQNLALHPGIAKAVAREFILGTGPGAAVARLHRILERELQRRGRQLVVYGRDGKP